MSDNELTLKPVLVCPSCGSSEKFVSNQYIEHHDAVFDGYGTWIDDDGCYDSEHDTDGALCTCCKCGHEGSWSDFIEKAASL